MPSSAKIIIARRAYEFLPDDLRLTALSTRPLQESIAAAFDFDSFALRPPPPTFGAVPRTTPPGLIFSDGSWASPDEIVTPIRSLFVERRRIVFTVASPSSAIDPLMDQLRAAVDEVDLSLDSPAIGPVRQVRDYSEISAHLSFPLENLVAPEAAQIFRQALDSSGTDAALLPTLTLQLHPKDEEYSEAEPHPADTLRLSIRAGFSPEERGYYSSAFLDTDSHLRYLKQLDVALGGEHAEPPKRRRKSLAGPART